MVGLADCFKCSNQRSERGSPVAAGGKKVVIDKQNMSLAAIRAAGDNLVDLITRGLSTQLEKYKIELEGIARSLSGAPSTPWHVSIGNQ
jgi:hypothetical protein